MWDPVSMFFCMWILNINMPSGRLSVDETIRLREEEVINKTIIDSTTLRADYEFKNY